MRKVNTKEIQQLYQFTREHYVEYFDLQTELVDHLACGIEANWKEKPNLSFEENLNKEFKKFGVFGFMDIIEEKRKAMGKRYLSIIWQEAKGQLFRPEISLSFIGLTLLFTYLLHWNAGLYIFVGIITALCIFLLFKTFRLRKKIKKQERVYFLEAMILQGGGAVPIVFFPIYILNLIDPLTSIPGGAIVAINITLALLLMSCLLFCWVAFYILPLKKEKILYQFHPEREWARG